MSRPPSSDAGCLGYTVNTEANGSPRRHPSTTSPSPPTPNHPSSSGSRPTRKKPVASRPIIACEECRRRKIGCSRTQPCNSCVRLKRHCIFLNQERHRSPRQDPKSSIERRIGSREESPHVGASEPSRPGRNLERPSLGQAQGLASARNMSGAQREGADDLCLRIGRMSITERIGDASRQDIVNMIDLALSQGENRAMTHELAPPGVYSDRIVTSIERCPGVFDTITQFLHPGAPIEVPSWPRWQMLCEWYFIAVDPIAHLLSKSAFEVTARYFYESILQRQSTRDSTKALVLAVSFASVASMSPSECRQTLGGEKVLLERYYQAAIEAQLQHADILGTTDPEIIRAAVIYLLPICSGEVAASTSAFVGALIHNAQVAGIDQFDGYPQELSLESQFRKQLWCQLLLLDIRTGEERGSASMVQGGAWENALPVDVNDHEIHGQGQQTSSWTDSTFSLIRMECYRARCQIQDLSNGLSLGYITTDVAAAKLDERKRWIEHRYLHGLKQNEPLQQCAFHVGQILVSSLDLLLFEERMHRETKTKHRCLRAALTIVKNAAILEQDGSLKQWSWFLRTYQQYKSIFFILLEVQRQPRLPEEDMIASALDHIFGCRFDLSLWQRSREVLQLIRERLAKMLDTGISPGQDTAALSNPTLWQG